jgi:hypothetical protein
VNGFLNDTAGLAGEQIYLNEINALLATPEPSTFALLGFGVSGLLLWRRISR